MNSNFYFRKVSIKLIISILFFTFLGSNIILGQRNMPVQTASRTNQGQIVSFSEETDFQDALQILNQKALQDEGKAITDPTQQKGAIGVEISDTHWKEALKKILLQRGMQWKENPNYYELTGARGKAAKKEPKEVSAFSDTTREVRIKALFFQADESKMNKAGVNWRVLQESPGMALKQLNLGISFGQGSPQLKGELQSEQSGGQQGSPMGSAIHNTTDENGDISIGAVLNVFEDNNLGKVLSKPTIKVTDGEEGEINIGQRFYITQRDFAGNTVNKQVRAGTQLKVTPNIIKDSSGTFIHLELAAEKSNAQLGRARPIINEQMVESDVLLVDGERTVLGGLFTKDEQTIRSGIPILKDLPWWVFGIRYLAGNEQIQSSRRNLLIFIQVELVPTIKERLDKKKEELQNIESDYKERQKSFKKDYESFEDIESKKKQMKQKKSKSTKDIDRSKKLEDTESDLTKEDNVEAENTQQNTQARSESSSGEAKYTIQILSTDDYEEALIESSRLTQKGIETFIQQDTQNGKQIYRVRTGKFDNKKDAENRKTDLENELSEEKVGDIWIGEL